MALEIGAKQSPLGARADASTHDAEAEAAEGSDTANLAGSDDLNAVMRLAVR
jgi:hypothetical protein